MVKFSFTSFVATILTVAATTTTAQELPACVPQTPIGLPNPNRFGNTIAGIACGDPEGRFTIACDALIKTGLIDAVSNVDARFTIWAPTNDAFLALPAETLELLLSEEGIPTLTNILLIHVAGGLITPDELTCGDAVETLGEPSQTFTECLSLGKLVQTGSNPPDMLPQYTSTTPIPVCNGFIYPITNVIMPLLSTGEPTLAPTKKMKKSKKSKKSKGKKAGVPI